jgi:hypothetical protein
MTHSIINKDSQAIVGYIHFSCFCGLDIYCFGNSKTGNAPIKAIDRFRTLLANQPAAIFSASDAPSAHCPGCGIEMELPSAEVLLWFADREKRRILESPMIDSQIQTGISA